MAQADRTIQNDTFPNVRADINNNLDALFSDNSGAVAPSGTVAFMDWIDLSGTDDPNPVWKKRNANNSGWVTIGVIASGTLELPEGNTLPAQSGNDGKYLTTDGTVASWAAIPAGSQSFVYTTDDTWTKPSDGNFALVTIWGGGGSGGRASTAGGGGGGACVQRLYRLSELPASVAITIGLGGAGRSTIGSGSGGGNTTFGALLTAYGGGGGDVGGGGGGGGSIGVGILITPGAGHGPSLTGGTGGSSGVSPTKGDFGGGGGGNQTSGTNGVGATAYWGGGGGGGRNSATSAAGGISLHGGNGSASNTGDPGAVPGGGSGATNATTGAGGNGLCLIYVW